MRGSCTCGTVVFDVEPASVTFHACHGVQCRHRNGSALPTVEVAREAIRPESADGIRVTADGLMRGQHQVAPGTCDAPDAFTFAFEVYIDREAVHLAFAGERPTRTQAATEPLFSTPKCGGSS